MDREPEWHRYRMVEEQIAGRGIDDPAVLAAMRAVPRHAFVPSASVTEAYADRPLPIGHGQTISQPYVVAWMTMHLGLADDDRVLEVGTGSGYAAAVLAEVAGEVWTVERHAELAAGARRALAELGYDNVRVVVGDGSTGWSERAPYDAIVVAAAAPDVPTDLVDQLAPGGRLVLPVEGRIGRGQRLVRIGRRDGEVEREHLGRVGFVPLVGEHGRPEGPDG